MKTALITGVTGQDGFYLSQSLLAKDYKVLGLIRRTSTPNTSRITELIEHKNFELVEGDVTDPSSITRIVYERHPHEVYNLAAQSHVGTSFNQPIATWKTTAEGCLNVLEAIRTVSPETRFYQASSSEMFGNNIDEDGFQRETTPLSPISPYAVAKTAAHHMVECYRKSYGLYACAGILFNHESPQRGETFVTRKITKYIANEIYPYATKRLGDRSLFVNEKNVNKLKLGNLEARRDWGHAADYVEAMWIMLQQEKPQDYVIATGETHSIREFLDEAFKVINVNNWERFVEIDQQFMRPYEVKYLKGDASKAKMELGWYPRFNFSDLVKDMVVQDISRLS